MKEEKRKWVMPKFLPHKYDVKLVNEDKVGGRNLLQGASLQREEVTEGF